MWGTSPAIMCPSPDIGTVTGCKRSVLATGLHSSSVHLELVSCAQLVLLVTLMKRMTVMTGMAFVKTWEQLAVCRIILGVFEAGFFPAVS